MHSTLTRHSSSSAQVMRANAFRRFGTGDKYTVFKFANVVETGGDGKSISQRR